MENKNEEKKEVIGWINEMKDDNRFQIPERKVQDVKEKNKWAVWWSQMNAVLVYLEMNDLISDELFQEGDKIIDDFNEHRSLSNLIHPDDIKKANEYLDKLLKYLEG